MEDLLIKNPMLLVGIGGAGSKIAQLTSKTVGCGCLVISNDTKDLADCAGRSVLVESGGWINPSSHKLRSFAHLQRNEIVSAIEGFSTVVIISNLAGRSGTALAPVICKLAKESNATVIAVAIMPFGFEKDRLFYAGTALRRIRETSDSVIVMDNDSFIDNNPELSREECFNITNTAIVQVTASISTNGIRKEMNVLCTSKPSSNSESSLRDSVAMLYENVSSSDGVKKAMVYVIGGDKVPVGELNRIVGSLRGMFTENGATDVALSTIAGHGGVRVNLVASAPQKTRFDRYDPIGDIIPKESVLDWDELDSCPDIQLAIPNME